jgi:hypothetical protein
MTTTAAHIEVLTAGLECHRASRDELAAALRSTYAMHERSELLIKHAEMCRCVTAFEAELARVA